MENIKSSYFYQKVFSLILEKRIFKIVKYNKALQKLLNINIINYKILSGKYILYETKGKGKEYDGYVNTLLFEGEYLNGERNGKGKEYIKDRLFLNFEGEYLNGKRKGKNII